MSEPNLIFLMRWLRCVGVDESEEAIAAVRRLAAHIAPDMSPERFRVERVESMSPILARWTLSSRAPCSTSRAMPAIGWKRYVRCGECSRRAVCSLRLATTVGQPNVKPLGVGHCVMTGGTTRFSSRP